MRIVLIPIAVDSIVLLSSYVWCLSCLILNYMVTSGQNTFLFIVLNT